MNNAEGTHEKKMSWNCKVKSNERHDGSTLGPNSLSLLAGQAMMTMAHTHPQVEAGQALGVFWLK